MNQWIKELQMLCKITWFEPQAAYSCFVMAFKSKPTFYMRTIPNISRQLKRLDEVIPTEFILAIIGGIICSDIESHYRKTWAVWEFQFLPTYCQFHNILKLFDVLPNFPFTTCEMMCDYYL